MGAYKNISNELKAFFTGHSIFKVLLTLDIAFIIGGLGVIILSEFVNVGGLLYSLAYYIFLLGLLLTYANFNQKMLYLGFLVYAAVQVINFLQSFFAKYSYLNYNAILTALIFGGLGYLVFKRSAVSGKV